MFEVKDTQRAFRALSETPIEQLALQRAFGLMLDFYELERAADAEPPDEDGDMMLFQWGANKWTDGSPFEINLTRQLICADGEDDQETHQLSLTYSFRPVDTLAALDNGNTWIASPNQLAETRTQILSSDPVIRCAVLDPVSVQLLWEQQ